MHGLSTVRLLCSVALINMICAPVRADDWPHWRGPQRNGIVAAKLPGAPADWKSAVNLWQVPVGEGATSPLIVSGQVLVLGWQNGSDELRCLDAETGREIWKQSYRCPRFGRRATGDQGLYSGPTSTPEFDPQTKLLFTLSADGDLICWNSQDQGRQRWHRNLYADFDVAQRPRHGRSGRRDYGYTTAPLAWGTTVIVEVGDDDGTLMAFDQQTGATVWTSECRDPAGHAGGLVPMTVEGVPSVAVLTYEGLLVARLDAGQEGRTIAKFPWTTDFANNIATPAVYEQSVLITSAYNRQAICRVEVGLDGCQSAWEQRFPSKVCSPIIHQNRIYWAWQQVRCLDFATGRELWSGGQFGDAGSCLLTADKMLVIWGGRGKLTIVDTAQQGDRYAEVVVRDRLARSDAWPHIAMASGRLFCKDREGQLTCIGLRP